METTSVFNKKRMIEREMRFIGKEGKRGLKTGRFYFLNIFQAGYLVKVFRKTTIKVVVWGKDNKKIPMLYEDIVAFLSDWK